jgi:hypothetical protein
MKLAATIIGILALAMGLLWIGQGMGWIHWPASSFMLDQSIWSIWGAILAAIGAAILFWARRRP